MELKSKFDVGQKVFKPFIKEELLREPCELCEAKGRVRCKIEGNGDYVIDCPECAARGDDHVVVGKNFIPLVVQLTIADLFYNLKNYKGFSYICQETGQHAHSESELYLTQEEAETASKEMCQVKEYYNGQAKDQSEE